MTGGKTFTAAVVDVGKISGGHEKVLTGSGDGVNEFIEERCELLKIHRIAVDLDDHIGFIVGAELCGRRGEGAELVKDVHCGVGEAFEAFDRLGFTFQPGVGTLAGLTGGGTGIEIADDGGQVKRIGEDEGIKSQHFGYFLSFHTVFWQEIQSASMARAYSSDWPKTVRVTVAGDAGL